MNIIIGQIEENAFHLKDGETRITFNYSDKEDRVYIDGNIYVEYKIKDEEHAKKIVERKLKQLNKL